MLGLVVIALILLQRLEREYGEAGEQAVGADYDQEHGHEVERDGRDGVLDPHGDEVAAAEGQHADNDDEPVYPGLLLAHVPAPEQLHGLGAAYAPEVEKQG